MGSTGIFNSHPGLKLHDFPSLPRISKAYVRNGINYSSTVTFPISLSS